MRAFTLPLVAVLGLALAQCSPQGNEDEAKPADFRSTVEVKLTPAAMAKLGEKGETAVLTASYFGIVTQDTTSLADPDDGTIHLGIDTYDLKLTEGQTVHLTAKALDVAKLPQVSQGKPILRVEGYAAKDGKRTATMHCNETQDYVEVMQKQIYTMHCDLNQE